jgi:hypothetical protein
MANQTLYVDGYQTYAHHEFMQIYYWPVSWFAVAAYLFMLVVGPMIMKNRAAFNLQRPLFYWNFCLCLFSSFGVLSILPEFADTLYNKGFESSYCWMGDQYQGYNGEWVWLFHASKLLELGDTVFLVLRKKPIKFLHWYHHSTVLLYAGYSYRYSTAACRWGVMMNFIVHSVMYLYFAYTALGQKCAKWVAPFVTGIQIWQFIMGLYISAAVTYKLYNETPSTCQCPLNVSIFQTFIYCTYLVLFAQFFYVTYLEKKLIKKNKTSKVE